MTPEEYESVRHGDFEWFVDNYDSLFAKYGKCHIAIRDKEILGTYPGEKDDTGKIWCDLAEIHEPGTFVLQFCDGTPEAYTVTINSPRVSFPEEDRIE